MLQRCKFLAHVDLSTSGASLLTNDAFPEGVVWDHLEHVNLSGNPLVSDEGLLRFVKGSSALLLNLALRWCQVTDRFFSTSQLSSLTSLDVSNCAFLSVAAIQACSRQCHKLSKLSIGYCANLILDSALIDAIKCVSDVRCDGLVVRGPLVLNFSKNFDLKYAFFFFLLFRFYLLFFFVSEL